MLVFNQLGYLPGVLEILSHSELIPEFPDAALTVTLTRKRYNSIKK